MSFTTLPHGVPHTQAPNHVLQDTSLSTDARILAFYIAGRPPNWRFWRDKILQDTGLSRGQYARAARQLEQRGYIKRVLEIQSDTKRKHLFFVVLSNYYTPPRPNIARSIIPQWMRPPKPGWHVPWAYDVIDHHDPMFLAVQTPAHQ